MGGHHFDVVLQQFDIAEDGVVDALQYIVGGVILGLDEIGVVDQSVTQRTDLTDAAL